MEVKYTVFCLLTQVTRYTTRNDNIKVIKSSLRVFFLTIQMFYLDIGSLLKILSQDFQEKKEYKQNDSFQSTDT